MDLIAIDFNGSRSDVHGNVVEPTMLGREEVGSKTTHFSDNGKERSLSILSLGEQEVESSFDEKEDEAKDGVLLLFEAEEGFL